MDIVETIQKCILRWDQGGDAECRDILITPHANPSDPTSNDVLTNAYYILLTACSRGPPTLPVESLAPFIKSVLDHLPSSSSSAGQSANAIAHGELLIDIVWSANAELEEAILETKTSQANADAVQEALDRKSRFVTVVKSILLEGILDPDLCRERLEPPLLAAIGLVANQDSFDKKEIRARTALFYKQNKFNLLREQSEGYSKLVAELTSSLGPAHSSSTGLPSETASAVAARAGPAWERVVGLIGYFDLDPNRALDIVLDVFSANLTTHSSFFLSFLSFSSWSNGGRISAVSSDDTMNIEVDPDQYRGKTLDEVLSLAERNSGFRPAPSSNGKPKVLAQVLGFKFSYYQSQDTENTPRSLYLTAALLIREGFITLDDIAPHITPTYDGMDVMHKQYLRDVETRISGAKINQLAMAAPLETNSTSKPSRNSASPEQRKASEKSSEGANQKLGLLHALLSVGAIRPTLMVLAQYPWMVDAYPALADLMISILKHSIAPLTETNLAHKEKLTSFTKPRAKFGASGVIPAPERRPQLTLTAPTPPSTNLVDFVFFYPQWTERIPVCSTLADIVDVVEPLMKFIGLHISRDPHFVHKFLRLGRVHIQPPNQSAEDARKAFISDNLDSPVRAFWFKILRLYLLPALPLIRGNAVCTVEIWNIMRTYDVTLRWRLYGEWKTQTYKSHPELRVRQVQADRESKAILRRLSHNTIDTLSGTVAKLAHSNPCIFFSNAVNQIMAYDNLAGVVIQSLNYVTIMGFDVLLFVVLDALANPNKDRVKDDGVNTSDWLLSLASFIGMLFRRYSSDITPLLKYIVHQLHNGQTSEIVVLRELIWKMAGIEPLPSLSDSQVQAMAGGPALRIEAVASTTRGARLAHGDALLKGPSRLGRALLESQLALPLLVQVAQQRQSCVFQAPNAHLKSLASFYDTTHGVLLQYLELLTSPSVILPEDYAHKIIPSLTELHDLYGISAPICMQIIRPIMHGILLNAALKMAQEQHEAAEAAEKRLKAELAAKRTPAAGTSRTASPNAGGQVTPSEQEQVPNPESAAGEQVPMEVDVSPVPPAPENPWVPELMPLFEEVRSIAPGNAAEVLGVGFYLTFWQLSTYELSPPLSKYEEECKNLRALSQQEDSKGIAADRSSDRARRATAIIHREKRNRLNDFAATLAKEMNEQADVRLFTLKRLAREKQHWFAHHPKMSALAGAFVEHCLQPRCLLSPMDADYCAQIIKVIHGLGTPGFSTLQCYDKLLGEHIKVVVFSCSEYEARNYGRFLLGILSDIWKWFQDESAYMHDNRSKSSASGKVTYFPGFRQKLFASSGIDGLLKWPDFQKVVRKWHGRIGSSLIACIETGEFMHVYNAIIVLKEILPVFPIAAMAPQMGARLDMAVNAFVEKEERGDLKILGKAYQASLKKRESFWAVPTLEKPSAPRSSAAQATKPIPSGPQAVEKARANGTSSPAPSQNDRRPASTAPPSAPSGPRSHQMANGSGSAAVSERPTPTPTNSKLALESIPRPEFVRRVRPASGAESSKASPPPTGPDVMDVDSPSTSARTNGASRAQDRPASPLPALPRELAQLKDSRPTTPSPLSSSVSLKDLAKATADEASQEMPPPVVPSQTVSAQELRETAKQTRPSDKADEKATRTGNDSRSQAPQSPPSRRRSPSPSSRPGTRNASAESRASGGRNRENTRSGEDSKPSERDSRQDSGRDSGRREGGSHRRSGRDSEREKDSERGDRDRRDRHGDREGRRDRERDRDRDEKRDRDRDRDRDRGGRDKDRERDHNRERGGDRERGDRHRSDKERDRKEKGTADRGSTNAVASTSSPVPADDRGLPARPETSRHRGQHGDDTLGKRRRGADDESERATKRPSRKESHHEDRSMRSSDKDKGVDRDRDDRTARDAERRKKDRDQPESENRGGLTIDTKSADKRVPDGPLSAKIPPSAPRAMSSNDRSNKGAEGSSSGRDRSRRDQGPRSPVNAPNGSPTEGGGGGGLRSRISEREPGTPSRSLPSGPAAQRSETTRRSDVSNRDEDGNGGRKRITSDRDREPPASGSDKAGKRLRINRDRYAQVQNHLSQANDGERSR
ncbi:transcription factor/nuclear export subunit protein 2-domain-containing protein [Cristinia sonorae]|uniref:THO complex subunit 2 n=1 Tax=Cristinia sonorae TaxID=1940300 RepID=A0A8K0XUF2_9AGAR|nr:transcription factor/nuclear export subunit protein 2-domain-containing protein [Cristinia sonorae]